MDSMGRYLEQRNREKISVTGHDKVISAQERGGGIIGWKRGKRGGSEIVKVMKIAGSVRKPFMASQGVTSGEEI